MTQRTITVTNEDTGLKGVWNIDNGLIVYYNKHGKPTWTDISKDASDTFPNFDETITTMLEFVDRKTIVLDTQTRARRGVA